MRGYILSGGYFLNAPVYNGQAEEKRAFYVERPPCLIAASLCHDKRKCTSRQTQVPDVTDT
ncbi:hypothetical protein, partial [Bacteroides heparinolyticus]|uniref:hypothetical protein n=1 Tax=Prevotella heparinolytica TaxID=28113 RepID=UPI0035A03CB0